jgi:hypothetical protein
VGKKPGNTPFDYWIESGETYVWLNVDVAGYTRRFANGMTFTAAGGFTSGLHGAIDPCIDSAPECENPNNKKLPSFIPQMRVALGYAF